MYALENRLIAELSGEGTVLREYIWLENEPLALREYELRPGPCFCVNDHRVTARQPVDSQGTVAWQSAALPFGQSQDSSGIGFYRVTEEMLQWADKQLNNRPRKCLHYQAPAEIFNHALIGARTT